MSPRDYKRVSYMNHSPATMRVKWEYIIQLLSSFTSHMTVCGLFHCSFLYIHIQKRTTKSASFLLLPNKYRLLGFCSYKFSYNFNYLNLTLGYSDLYVFFQYMIRCVAANLLECLQMMKNWFNIRYL